MGRHAPKGPHSQYLRDKIRTTALLNRLQDYGLGRVELSRGQVAAIAILLRKVLPDVASVDIGTASGKPLQVSIVKFSDLADGNLVADPVADSLGDAADLANPQSTLH